jgi:chaperone modulatory protein CbpM
MTDHLTEDDVLAAVPGLTRSRLVAFIETEVVIPLRRETGPRNAHVFRQVDLARLQFLCELADDFELDEAALGVIITLIDQLHAARNDLRAIARAVDAEPPDVRSRIGAAVIRSLR